MFDGLSLGWYSGKGGCGALLTNLGTFDIYKTQTETNSDCSLTSDKRVLLNLPAGFAAAVDSAIQCTSLISYVLDVHLQQMEQDGFIGAAWIDHVKKISNMQCPAVGETLGVGGNDSSSGFSLGIKDMGGIFLFHLVLSAIALLFAFYQRFRVALQRPEKKMRPIKVEAAVTTIKENLDESMRSIAGNFSLDESFKGMKGTLDGSMRSMRSMTSMRNISSGDGGAGGGGSRGSRPMPTSFSWSSQRPSSGAKSDDDASADPTSFRWSSAK